MCSFVGWSRVEVVFGDVDDGRIAPTGRPIQYPLLDAVLPGGEKRGGAGCCPVAGGHVTDHAVAVWMRCGELRNGRAFGVVSVARRGMQQLHLEIVDEADEFVEGGYPFSLGERGAPLDHLVGRPFFGPFVVAHSCSP